MMLSRSAGTHAQRSKTQKPGTRKIRKSAPEKRASKKTNKPEWDVSLVAKLPLILHHRHSHRSIR